jgi:WD40 repeat protein
VLRDLPATYLPVLAVALSPDETRLAVGRGARVYVHDLTRPGRPVTDVFAGARDAVQSLAWSPDGGLLAAGDYGRVVVRDLRGAKPAVTLGGLAGRVTALLFVSDGATLLAADGEPGRSGRLCRFRLPETEPQATVAAHGDTVLALRGTRDGSLVASAGADKLVKLWDAATLKETGRLEGHSGHVLGLAFKADDSLLATAGTDREVKVWDVKTREQKATAGPYPAAVTALAWPRDGGGKGGKLLAGCEDGTVRQGTDAAAGPPMPDPAADVLYSLAATADGKHLYGGCHDGLVYVWDAGGKLEGKLPAAPAVPDPAGGK